MPLGVLHREVSPDAVPSLGRPTGGVTAWVLDARLRQASPGAVGSLVVAGDAVPWATGDAGATAARVVAGPFGRPGERWLASGLVVRWSRTGDLVPAVVDTATRTSGPVASGPIDESLLATVRGIVSDVLGLEDAPEGSFPEGSFPEGSFTDLGGTSLSAARVAGRLSATLGHDVGVRAVFEASTIADIARAAQDAVAGGRRDLPPLLPVDRDRRLPLSHAQQRMWYLNRLDEDREVAGYVIPLAVRLRGEIDPAAVRSAIGDLLARHEVLRTVYPDDADGPHQVVVDAATAATQLDLAIADTEDEALAVLGRPFDLRSDLPLRARIAPGTSTHDAPIAVVLAVHHIAADGESVPVLLRDLLALYAARVGDPATDLPQLPIQYADHAAWHRAVVEADESSGDGDLAFWSRTLDGAPAVLDLPLDRPRPTAPSGLGVAGEAVVGREVA